MGSTCSPCIRHTFHVTTTHQRRRRLLLHENQIAVHVCFRAAADQRKFDGRFVLHVDCFVLLQKFGWVGDWCGDALLTRFFVQYYANLCPASAAFSRILRNHGEPLVDGLVIGKQPQVQVHVAAKVVPRHSVLPTSITCTSIVRITVFAPSTKEDSRIQGITTCI
jgi:hypothetical protein